MRRGVRGFSGRRPALRNFEYSPIDAFGPWRCMFESNFAVDRGSCSYALLWNAFKRLAAGCSAAEQSELFAGTAARIHRIEPLADLSQPHPSTP